MGMDASKDMQIFCSLNTECHRISLKFIKDFHLSSLELLSHRLFLHRSNCSRPSAMRIPDRMRTPHVSANSLRPANCSKEAQRYLIGLDYWKIFEHIFKRFWKKLWTRSSFFLLSHNLFFNWKFQVHLAKQGEVLGATLQPYMLEAKIGASLYRCASRWCNLQNCQASRVSGDLPQGERTWLASILVFCQILPKNFWDTFFAEFFTKQFFLESADITFSTSWKLPWTSSARRRFKPAGFCCNLL